MSKTGKLKGRKFKETRAALRLAGLDSVLPKDCLFVMPGAPGVIEVFDGGSSPYYTPPQLREIAAYMNKMADQVEADSA